MKICKFRGLSLAFCHRVRQKNACPSFLCAELLADVRWGIEQLQCRIWACLALHPVSVIPSSLKSPTPFETRTAV